MDVLLRDILSSMVELQRSRVSQNSDALNSTFATRNITIFLNHVNLTFIRIPRCPFSFAIGELHMLASVNDSSRNRDIMRDAAIFN